MNEMTTTNNPSFALAAPGALDADTQAMLMDMAADLDPDTRFNFTRIKVPNGDGATFTIRGEDPNDVRTPQSFQAVVVHAQRVNVYWGNSPYGYNTDQLKTPLCSSHDGKVGISREGERIQCKTCRFNQYGSNVDDRGQRTNGKACKNCMELYLKMNGDSDIYVMSAPPTSMKEVNRALQKVISSGRGYNSVVFNFSLKFVETGSTHYSKVVMTPVAEVPRDDMLALMQLREDIKGARTSEPISEDTYPDTASAPSAPSAPALQAPDGDLPWAQQQPPAQEPAWAQQAPPPQPQSAPWQQPQQQYQQPPMQQQYQGQGYQQPAWAQPAQPQQPPQGFSFENAPPVGQGDGQLPF